MSTETKELMTICEQLPAARRAEVVDFARFLLSRAGDGDGEGDERWEQIIADPRPRPKLEAFLKASREERSEPLDPDRL